MNDTRPSWDEYFMNITRETAMRGTCLMVKIGAVAVRDKTIVATGYVGAPRKTQDCIERGFCLRRKLGIPSGHRYELCRSVHAEMNVIINAARAGVSLVGADLYLWGVRVHTGEGRINMVPCFICKKMIINAGIARVHARSLDSPIKTFDIAKDWVAGWQTKDMIDDIEVFDGNYEKVQK
jgi:dCMP deaminase